MKHWILILAVVVLKLSPALAIELLRGPYLQNLSARGVTVVWYTVETGLGRLSFYDGQRWRTKTEATAGQRHEIQIENLKADRRYQYQIKQDSQILGRSFFRTALRRESPGQVRLGAIGDSGTGGAGQLAVAQALADWHPDLVIHTGDIVYEDGAASLYDVRFFEPYQTILKHTPIFPIPGNHDAPNIGAYQEFFSLPVQSGGSERYYSFNFGPLHLAAVDTNLDFSQGSEQYEWLEADLAQYENQRRAWKIVYFHHPPFSIGEHGDDLAVQSNLVPLFERYRVDLVLSGHEHAYERSVKLNLSDINDHKVLYVVTGGGGQTLYPQEGDSPYLVVYQARLHFVGIMASPTSLRIKAIDPEGEVFDAVSLSR